MSWFRERRYDFISWRLAHIGEIRREHLVNTFGISVPQASEDLGKFNDAHPGTMSYDLSRKCYIAEAPKSARPIEVDKRGRLVFVIG